MSERDVSPPKMPFNVRPRLVVIVLVVILVIALSASSFFVVDQTEQGIVLRLGRYLKSAEPGLHFKLPFGIDQNYNVPIQEVQYLEFGFRTDVAGEVSLISAQDYPRESIMLTGDLNIIDVEWTIQYRITDARAWLFSVESISGGLGVQAMPIPGREDQDRRVKTIRDVTQSVVNALVGDLAIVDIIGSQSDRIQSEATAQINSILTSFNLGITITEVQMRNVVPPVGRVQDAFEDVNRAVQDYNRLINEGREQYNTEVPRAAGQAQRLIEQAEGYRVNRENTADGDVARFNQVYEQYRIDPDTTRTRLYYEMIEEVFGDEENVELVDRNLQNFIPLLNLGDRNAAATGGQQ